MTSFKKQNNMQKRKTQKRSLTRKNKQPLQSGGVSNACTLDASTSMNMLTRNSTANLHNVNPQASLDLDNNFMKYGGAVPLGSNIVGGAKCGDEGVGTGHSKSSTFQEYLNNINNQLDLKGGATHLDEKPLSAKYKSKSKYQRNQRNQHKQLNTHKKLNTYKKRSQKGAGFSTDPSEFIGGMPVYKGYDDCCPPAIIGGNLAFGSPDKSVCGYGAMKGGNVKQNKQKQYNKQHKQHKQHKQRGGDWNTIRSSKPAVYSDAFNGTPGVFAYPDDMSKRTFDEKQPSYF